MGVHAEIVQTHISVTRPMAGEPARFEGHCSQVQLAEWTHHASLVAPESCTLLAAAPDGTCREGSMARASAELLWQKRGRAFWIPEPKPPEEIGG